MNYQENRHVRLDPVLVNFRSQIPRAPSCRTGQRLRRPRARALKIFHNGEIGASAGMTAYGAKPPLAFSLR